MNRQIKIAVTRSLYHEYAKSKAKSIIITNKGACFIASALD